MSESTALVYADADGCATRLITGLTSIGKRAILVKTPLDTVRVLQDRDHAVDTVFVSLEDSGSLIAPFFAFLHDEYPWIKRIAFAERGSRHRLWASALLCQHDLLLWSPWNQENFEEVLKSAVARDIEDQSSITAADERRNESALIREVCAACGTVSDGTCDPFFRQIGFDCRSCETEWARLLSHTERRALTHGTAAWWFD